MKDAISSSGAVVAPDPLAAEAGAAILKQGGNAIDAAVAAAMVECVVQPHNVGLGGYAGTMVAYLASQNKVVALDFDSRAPLAATPEMFPLDRCTDGWDIEGDGDLDPAGPNEHGGMCITAPPILAGLSLALQRFGTMSFADVTARAHVLAEEGFVVYPQLARTLSLFAQYADEESRLSLLADGTVPSPGEMLVQKNLARVIKTVREHGPQAFYSGKIARTIIDRVRGLGGVLCEEDFANVRPRLEEPLSVKCGDCEVFTPPPPAGGLTALQMINVMEKMSLGDADFGSPTYYRLMIEAARHAWADRFNHLGDPLFIDVPINELLSGRRADEICGLIRSGTSPATIEAGLAGAGHTVHLVAVDAQRNMVSMTATHGSWFGSLVGVKELGIVLGHGMSRFEPAPGRPNSIAPGKRMQHNMSPMLITKNDKPYCVIGLPGGRKIVNVSALLAHAIGRYGLTCGEAIEMPRFHTDGICPVQVDSRTLAADIQREVGDANAIIHSRRLGGPAAGVMYAAATDQLLSASEVGPECVAAF